MGNASLEYVIEYFYNMISFLKTVYPFPADTLLGRFDYSMYHLLVAFSFISIGFDIVLSRSSKDDD